MTERSIFLAALDIADPAEQAAFLDRACDGDPDLRRRVDELLDGYDEAGSFLEPADRNWTVVQIPLDRPSACPVRRQATPAPVRRPPQQAAGAGVVAGRYKLLELLGEGGMGAVWLAEQSEPVRRKVALKLIRAGMDSKAVLARFEAERQALALMDHPNIAKVLDAGVADDGRPFFVMELVKGVPITEFCDARRLTARQRLGLFVPVCRAVQHAHTKGVIHRDLKPSNVLVAMYDAQPVPKVIDFGLAKATGQPLTDATLHTAFEAVVGTPAYMSPEQAAFNQLDVDTRSDVYSLGVILYELLTGTTPVEKERFRAAALLEMLRLVREVDPPRPSARLSSAATRASLAATRGTEPAKLSRLLRGDLDWVVMKALEKDRDRRYETANGLARDVERYLADEVIDARPPGAGYRVRKFLRKYRGPVAAAGVVVLALVAGVAGTTAGLIRAEEARRAEADQRRSAELQRAVALAERDAKEQARQAEAGQRVRAEEQTRVAEAQRQLAESETARAEEQRARAEEAKRRAEDGKAAAGDVARFVEEDLLGGAAAHVHSGLRSLEDPLTALRNSLDRAARAAGERFGDRPVVEARVRRTLGMGYQRIGDHTKAAAQLDRAAQLFHREHGPDHPDTLTTLNNLAVAYQDGGRAADAVQILERVRLARSKAHGPDHLNTLTTLNDLALAYLRAGRADDALRLFKDLFPRAHREAGPAHPLVTTATLNLVIVLDTVGRFTNAPPEVYSAVFALAQSRRSERGREFARLLAALGSHLLGIGEPVEAEWLLRTCLAIREAEQPDDWTTFNAKAVLGGALLGQKRYAEAEPLLRAGFDGMKQREKSIPPQGRERLPEAASRLAGLCTALGRPDEAARWRAEYPFAAPPPRPVGPK